MGNNGTGREPGPREVLDLFNNSLARMYIDLGYRVRYYGDDEPMWAVMGGAAMRCIEIDGEEWTAERLRDLVRAARCVQREGVSADGTEAQITEHARLCAVLDH